MNNATLYNAAFCAFIGGVETSRVVVSGVSGSYAGVVAAAIAFATQVDAGIPVSEGLNPDTSFLLFSICTSQMDNRFPVSIVPTSYATQATAICALYTAAVTSLA